MPQPNRAREVLQVVRAPVGKAIAQYEEAGREFGPGVKFRPLDGNMAVDQRQEVAADSHYK